MASAAVSEASGGRKLVWLGASLAVFGQFIGATSMLLMKRAAVREAALPFYERRTFQLAFALFFFNTVVLDAAVYALAPLTIIAPITALGIVFVNAGIAAGVCVEREAFGARGALANALIVAGLVGASACGPHGNTTPTIEQMYAMAAAPAFLAYALPGGAVALGCVGALRLGALRPRSCVKTVWCAAAAAVFGSFSVLCFKGVATVARLTLEGNNQLRRPGTWALLAGAALCAPANVTLMNLTFEESDASYGMPLYQALIILATIVSGGLFYDEFGPWAESLRAEGRTLWAVGFGAGVLTILVGIGMVATSRAPARAAAGGAGEKQAEAGRTCLV
jgi:hypothetical protein